jgi:hypothetical protein
MTTISKSDITALFKLPQQEAAFVLGISLSALKKACRRVEIKRWPYQRNYLKCRGRAKYTETQPNQLPAQNANERERNVSSEKNDISAPLAILHVDGDFPSHQASRCSEPDNNQSISSPCAESFAASSNNFDEAGTFLQGVDIFDAIDAVYSRSNDDCNHGSEYLAHLDSLACGVWGIHHPTCFLKAFAHHSTGSV